MNKFLQWLRILCPDYWLMMRPYSADWDRLLNLWLDKYELTEVSDYTATIHGRKIWIGNYPYSFATPRGWGLDVRPKRATILRVKRRLVGIEGSNPFREIEEIERLESMYSGERQ